jgi:hypothetical protein
MSPKTSPKKCLSDRYHENLASFFWFYRHEVPNRVESGYIFRGKEAFEVINTDTVP